MFVIFVLRGSHFEIQGAITEGGKGAAVFAEGLSGAVASGLGKVRYLN